MIDLLIPLAFIVHAIASGLRARRRAAIGCGRLEQHREADKPAAMNDSFNLDRFIEAQVAMLCLGGRSDRIGKDSNGED